MQCEAPTPTLISPRASRYIRFPTTTSPSHQPHSYRKTGPRSSFFICQNVQYLQSRRGDRRPPQFHTSTHSYTLLCSYHTQPLLNHTDGKRRLSLLLLPLQLLLPIHLAAGDLRQRQVRPQHVEAQDARLVLEEHDELRVRVVRADAVHDRRHVHAVGVRRQPPGGDEHLAPFAARADDRRVRAAAVFARHEHGAAAELAVALPGRAADLEARARHEALVVPVPLAGRARPAAHRRLRRAHRRRRPPGLRRERRGAREEPA
mmetsp:Transcript_43867/g.137844  ORF Transcript_43867/g.137844 Transcript_43867/m.137844 type:complete len:261 (-) Transcript_43867:271-1053(-)